MLDEADHMADLGFLPAVPAAGPDADGGQRLLFSATLDAGVDMLVKRFLHAPRTHEADSASRQWPPWRITCCTSSATSGSPVLADLTSAPGPYGRLHPDQARCQGAGPAAQRPRRADRRAARQPGPERPQPATWRRSTTAGQTLVATDIAARGIHVDDVALVMHADPPVEHKAYLHRSGRTARAGSSGTVVTLMTEAQVDDVRALTRAAGIKPTITRVRSLSDPILREVAPGARRLVQVTASTVPAGSSHGDRGPATDLPRHSGPRRSQTRPESSGGRGRSGRTRQGAGSATSIGVRSGTGSVSHSATSFSRRTRSR